ncbi:ankyrin repeat-containing domain protein [Lactarius pseudohatsudake]|nr:ankyrin repeat-containing domain protein [Lactarius pseudohatsudake]
MVSCRFRWVFCQLDTLRRCVVASIRQALDELPVSLDDTYERILQDIPKQKREHAHRLFQCLIASSRPLEVQELAEIFAIQFDSKIGIKLEDGWRPEDAEDAVLSACSSLVSVVKAENSQIVQFSHFSVREFLTSDRLATSTATNLRYYHPPLESAHMIMAQACLAVLFQLDEKADRKRIKGLPLAFYAAQHWADHARFKNIESQIQDRIEFLFDATKPHFAAWTWIYDGGKGDGRPVPDLGERSSPPRATPLHYAVLCGLSWTTKRLVNSRRQDIDAGHSRFGTPMCAALFAGHLEIARFLLEQGANANMESMLGETPLQTFSSIDHLEVMRLLLDFGADANVCNSFGLTALHEAAIDGQYEVVRMLLQHNADVNTRGFWDFTPLHYASCQGHVEVARLLIDHGANLNAHNNSIGTPLHVALGEGKVEVVRLLLAHGADVHIPSMVNTTLSQLASESGFSEIAQVLLDHGTGTDGTCDTSTFLQ